MTRETKLGLFVAGAFLILLGGLITRKIIKGEIPAFEDQALAESFVEPNKASSPPEILPAGFEKEAQPLEDKKQQKNKKKTSNSKAKPEGRNSLPKAVNPNKSSDFFNSKAPIPSPMPSPPKTAKDNWVPENIPEGGIVKNKQDPNKFRDLLNQEINQSNPHSNENEPLPEPVELAQGEKKKLPAPVVPFSPNPKAKTHDSRNKLPEPNSVDLNPNAIEKSPEVKPAPVGVPPVPPPPAPLGVDNKKEPAPAPPLPGNSGLNKKEPATVPSPGLEFNDKKGPTPVPPPGKTEFNPNPVPPLPETPGLDANEKKLNPGPAPVPPTPEEIGKATNKSTGPIPAPIPTENFGNNKRPIPEPGPISPPVKNSGGADQNKGLPPSPVPPAAVGLGQNSNKGNGNKNEVVDNPQPVSPPPPTDPSKITLKKIDPVRPEPKLPADNKDLFKDLESKNRNPRPLPGVGKIRIQPEDEPQEIPATPNGNNDPKPPAKIGISSPEPVKKQTNSDNLGVKVQPPSPGSVIVRNYNVQFEKVQPGMQNFQKISQKMYGSTAYARALMLYNQNHPAVSQRVRQNPQKLMPGDTIVIPDLILLEERYSKEIPNLRPLPSTPAIAINTPKKSSVGQNKPKPVPVPNRFPPRNTKSRGNTNRNPNKTWSSRETPKVYQVRGNGERIIEIAQRELGDPRRWTEIFQMNPQINPAIPIPGGTRLKIPGK